MRAFSSVILVLALFAVAFGACGCALLGPSVEKAEEIANKREDELFKAVETLKAAEGELRELASQLDAAIKADDKTAIEKLGILVSAALSKRDAAKDAADAAQDIFAAAVQDFKDAKSASDYIGTVLGWLKLGLGALGLGTAGVAGVVAKRRGEALSGTTNLVEKLRPEDDKDPTWVAATGAMNANLSTGAKKAIEKFRP